MLCYLYLSSASLVVLSVSVEDSISKDSWIVTLHWFFESKVLFVFCKLVFTLHKAEQPLQGIKLKGKGEDKGDNRTAELIKTNLKIQSAY